MSTNNKKKAAYKTAKQLLKYTVYAVGSLLVLIIVPAIFIMLPAWIVVLIPGLLDIVGNWNYGIFLLIELGIILAIYGIWRLYKYNLSSIEDE